MDASTANEWLNLSDAAALLGVHPSTLRAWADRGDIPAHRTPGKHRRFRRADIETWAASRREAHISPGQLIVENVLGRTRLQLAEGRLAEAGWYQRFDDVRRRALRETGHSQLRLLLGYLADDQAAMPAEVESLGQTYERLGREAGLSLAETVGVFLYFRDFLYDSVIDVYQASGQRAAREWAAMHRRIAAFTNAILLALVAAHEAETHS
ncbi:MAG: helix-turn-helix domain-containing protein [Anaerolineales bacterium]|nr:helix-turn-helix domain-containing protein [Anaerolineales bacterium]